MIIKKITGLNKLTTGLAGAVAIGAGSSAYGSIVVVSVPANIVPATLPQTALLTRNWDINSDGTNDFQFFFRQPQQSGVDWQCGIFPLGAGSFTFGTPGFSSTFFYAQRFNAGDTISAVPPPGAVQVGSPSEAVLASRFLGSDYGQFQPPNSQGFLGLQFTTASGTFFGYIQVKVNRSPGAGQPGFQFISAAYDNTPGTPIVAGAVPEPGTLALLAVGAAGVVAIQRRRKAAKS